jgi:hypothetical protein
MIRFLSAALKCGASSIVACVTCRSGFFSCRKRRTTSVTPSSGVNVMKTMPPVSFVLVRIDVGRAFLVKPDDLTGAPLPLLTPSLERLEP